MEERSVQKSVAWLQGLAKGMIGHELEAITHGGLQIIEAREGFIRCNFIVPTLAADEDGNWHVGAMATLIDSVGGAATHSFAGHVKTSADFNISFYSTAKIQEEVEIEAKVVGDRGKLTSVQVEVRRRNDGEVIALGKEWMVSTNISSSQMMIWLEGQRWKGSCSKPESDCEPTNREIVQGYQLSYRMNTLRRSSHNTWRGTNKN